MKKEQITDKEGICLLTIFIMGSTMLLGTGGTVKNDAWISGITGILMAVPIILVYSNILSHYPGRDLYDILKITLGGTIAKVVSLIYIWYSFHLGALVIRNFGEFVDTVAMPETPLFFPMLCMGLVCIVGVRLGIEVLARISAYFLPVLLTIIVIVQLLAIPLFEFGNLKPIFGNGLVPILKGGFNTFSFPFAETVLFTSVFYTLKTKKSIYRVYLWGLFFAGGLIVYITMRNIVVLGNGLSLLYFPSHIAVSRIKIGDFIERIEVTVAIVFVYGIFIKAAVCLFVTCKGIAKVFNIDDYRYIVIQVGLLMIYFSQIIYDNIMEMQYWAFKVYPYYAFPFQVIMPIILFITIKVRARR